MADGFDLDRFERNRAKLIAGHAYDPSTERDACGVGLVCAIDGKPRREVVELAIRALKAVWHRGAVDADGKTGDGAGILVSVPQDFFAGEVERIGHKLRPGPIAVGQIFLPRTDLSAQETCRTIVESEVLHFGFYIYGWRQVPVDTSVIGEKANATRPEIEQIMLACPPGLDGESLDRALFLCRKRIEKRVAAAAISQFYICSFSVNSLIYKGMFLAEHLDEFYPDLTDERFAAAVAIFHQRYSTNTFPEWRLAQPFRMLAHNGEINTLKGNVNWMKSHEIRMAAQAFGEFGEDVKPVIQPGCSDSSALDNTFEVLVRAGRDAPMAKCLLIPEALSLLDEGDREPHRALYTYCNAVMEPWDGPAAICATDGRWVIAGKDRNGLRPLRATYTDDGLLIVGSEAGMCGVPEERIVKKDHIGHGRMVAVDLAEGRLYGENEILDHLSERHPYTEWLTNTVELEAKIGPGPEPRAYGKEELIRRQAAAGFSLEDLELILAPLMEDGKEAVGSMGDDAPLAVLSERYRPLSHFFRQNFSQVTNPPIDPLRETRVMSLKTRFKNLGNILAQDEAQTDVYVLESPVLTNGMYARIVEFIGEKNLAVIDCTMPEPEEGARPGETLRAALDRVKAEAEEAALRGCGQVVLSDEGSGPGRVAMPMILATAGVHSHLVAAGLRSYVSIIARSAECLDTHYFAVLVGVGATAVNAYLAQETIQDRLERGLAGDLSLRDVCLNFKGAIEAGLLKIISKMGISVISSYRGGYNFEAVGLSRALTAEFFPGMPSRISGIGLAGLERMAVKMHRKAWSPAAVMLPVGGFYKARRTGEAHAFEARLIHSLQQACDSGSFEAFKRYSDALRANPPVSLRDLLDWRPTRDPVPLDEVESVNEIRKRFNTPGMSLGALSPEAHGAANIAMNRIGARSVSGEGGEDPARYTPLPNGDNPNSAVKQVASGRFGVTAQYLNQCREIEIKVAQGAKPGEGGQLPGFKVTEMIARLRHSTPGRDADLAAAAPRHLFDRGSGPAHLRPEADQSRGAGVREAGLHDRHRRHRGGRGQGQGGRDPDLRQRRGHRRLVADLHQVRRLPLGDGAVRGPPGADPERSAALRPSADGRRHPHRPRRGDRRHAGRRGVWRGHRQPDRHGLHHGAPVPFQHLPGGGVHPGRGPARALHRHAGQGDQPVQLHRRGGARDPGHARPALAGGGDRPHRPAHPGLAGRRAPGRPGPEPAAGPRRSGRQKPYCTMTTRNEPLGEALDVQIIRDAAAFLNRGEKMQLTYTVANTSRAIGARISSAIVRKYGMDKLPHGHLTVELKGSAGQSLGAFSVQGLRIELTGEANDYVGKGLSGATLVIKPPARLEAPHQNAIIGNTVLYGATAGRLFAAGRAGERFAVRNSGAETVVEGCGANGCEYMTGGTVVILGSVGDNFAAGMTGGMAFVLDLEGRFEPALNRESVVVQRLASPYWEKVLRALVAEHAAETGSGFAADILRDWTAARGKFWQVCPKEMISRLAEPLVADEKIERA